MPTPVNPNFFPSADAFRAWLNENHAVETELWVGYHKRHTGRPSLTWEESVDAALCFGWIDGLRKGLDAFRYVVRFSRRKADSIWSVRNIGRVRELVRLKLMHPVGLEAYYRLNPKRSAVYSFEQRKTARLSATDVRRFKEKPRAWAFFRAQPPSYRRTFTFWVVSGKKEETRRRRLDRVIAASAQGCRIDPYGPTYPKAPAGVTFPGGRAKAPA
jgi:uncharacterized protein YdeI (YjbR/CyaY-like superfamily)